VITRIPHAGRSHLQTFTWMYRRFSQMATWTISGNGYSETFTQIVGDIPAIVGANRAFIGFGSYYFKRRFCSVLLLWARCAALPSALIAAGSLFCRWFDWRLSGGSRRYSILLGWYVS